jgi:ABC-type sugar transport system substrate-binding protein
MKRSSVLLLLLALGGCSGQSSAERGVVLFRYSQGSESTEQRERGFLETLRKDYPQIPILSDNQYLGTTEPMAQDRAQQLLLKYQGRVTGVFAVCEPNANGVLGALEQTGLVGKVTFIGFDSGSRVVNALKQGHMQGVVLQDPVRMGYLAVKTMVDHLEGRPVERRVNTGEVVATPENMHKPDIKRLLYPEQYEGSDALTVANPKFTIAVIPKGTTHEFWKSVHYGAVQAAKELGNVQVEWKGPQTEADRDQQIDLVQNYVTKQVSGICLAPLDARSLVDPVKQAVAAGIPVVIYDSALEDESQIVSYVATDNERGGALAAQRMAEALGAASKSAPPAPASDAP